MQNQAYVFLIFILTGLLIGFVFDIFRILRKSFKTLDLITYIEDAIFWIISGFIIVYVSFKFNNGEIRFFIFLGIIGGLALYLLLFSKSFIKISVSIILFVKKIVYKTFNIINRIFRKILFKPICFICINIHKIMSKFIKNTTKIKLNKKNKEFKKDLT